MNTLRIQATDDTDRALAHIHGVNHCVGIIGGLNA